MLFLLLRFLVRAASFSGWCATSPRCAGQPIQFEAVAATQLPNASSTTSCPTRSVGPEGEVPGQGQRPLLHETSAASAKCKTNPVSLVQVARYLAAHGPRYSSPCECAKRTVR